MKQLLRVMGYARNLWPYYAGITFFAILVSATALLAPFIVKLATDIIVNSLETGRADVQGALLMAILFFVVDISNTFFTNFGGYLGDVMSAKLRKQLSERYYLHLLKLPQIYYDTEMTGKIINRLNRTIYEVTQFANMFANNFFQMFLTVFFGLIIIALYSWQIAILVAILYPSFLWLTAINSKKWQQYQDAKNYEYDASSGRFAEVISQIKVVKSFVQETLEFRHFERRYHTTVKITEKQSRHWHRMDIIRRSFLNIIFLAIFAYLFVTTAEGRLTIGEMVLLVQIINTLRFPIFNMSMIVDQTQKAIAGSKEYFRVMEMKPAIADKSAAPDLVAKKGVVKFEEVTFGYLPGETVLHDITFEAKPGQKLALVGESGEGKTTITSLLLRLYEVDSGKISIDGTSISDVRQTSLRQHIATVFQEPALFSGTIRENIAYSSRHAGDKEIIAAAKAANAHDFITKLEQGYDTEIGERGLKLSGGQKQRIAIARAILKDAPILVLDEATSSLDNKAESLVQEALDRLMRGRTTIIIAHRLSTIAHVDTIVTLKNGRVDEIGSPQELARTEGIYAQLLKLQTEDSERTKARLKQFEIDVE
jgi:ATP-binding cassette subfamily B protein